MKNSTKDDVRNATNPVHRVIVYEETIHFWSFQLCSISRSQSLYIRCPFVLNLFVWIRLFSYLNLFAFVYNANRTSDNGCQKSKISRCDKSNLSGSYNNNFYFIYKIAEMKDTVTRLIQFMKLMAYRKKKKNLLLDILLTLRFCLFAFRVYSRACPFIYTRCLYSRFICLRFAGSLHLFDFSLSLARARYIPTHTWPREDGEADDVESPPRRYFIWPKRRTRVAKCLDDDRNEGDRRWTYASPGMQSEQSRWSELHSGNWRERDRDFSLETPLAKEKETRKRGDICRAKIRTN